MIWAVQAIAAAPRATWVWEAQTFRMLKDPVYRAASLDFLQAQDFTTVYLYADSYLGQNIIRDDPGLYEGLVSDLHGRGIKTYALLGSALLNTQAYVLPSNRSVAEAMFQRVLDYNTNAAAGARFDGVNLDIEPYLLPEWDNPTGGQTTGQSRTVIAGQYLDLSERFREMKQQYLAGIGVTDPTAFPIGPATPFWFDAADLFDTTNVIDWGGAGAKPMYQHVQDIHDYVSILDYRDFVLGQDGIQFHAIDELNYAVTIGKKVVIAVETSPVLPPKITFFEEGPRFLESELSLADGLFSAFWPAGFDGFAIHDFLNYQRLLGVGPDIPEPTGFAVWVLGCGVIVGGWRRVVR